MTQNEKRDQWKREIEKQIQENKERKEQMIEKEKDEDQNRIMIDAYYNDQYPVYKNQYYMGKLQPCSECHTVYPKKKL